MICGVLLCAGASTRFGSDKLLHALPDGSPLVAATARAYVGALERVLAVIRPGQRRLREVLEGEGCEVMETDRSLEGMGASLAAGVEATAGAQGWIVGLGDMPFVAIQTIGAVRAQLEAGALVAAPRSAGGRRGHPVGFHARLRGELVLLGGDEGARSIVERHLDELVEIPVDDAGIYRDIDRREDLLTP